MANHTENLNLTLPLGSDRPDVNILNQNFRRIDSACAQERELRISGDVDLAAALKMEADRAANKESLIENALNNEVLRATDAENRNSAAITNEANRAINAEGALRESLQAEVTRSTSANTYIQNSLNEEIARATRAEKENANAVIAEKSRAVDAETALQNAILQNKPIWDDKYTRNEIDNKFSALESKIDWKESVETYDDIETTYPTPEDGWTVNVKDTDYTYRYNGTEWVCISANAIPKATDSVDGILTGEDHAKYEDAYTKRHVHDNKSILDTITQTLLDYWNAAYAHISDTAKHITATERTDWNDANSKKHEHGNKSILDGITSEAVASWNAGTNVKVDGELNNTSTNPVQNRVIYSALEGKSDRTHAHNYAGSSSAGGVANSAAKWENAVNINGMSVQGDENRANYGICTTPAAAAEKVVACAGFTLMTGAEITVKFTMTNTASSPTLNVNGTGAKSIYYRGAAISPDYLAANRTYTFRYNGGQYELVGDININTTYGTGTETIAGIAKLYAETGTATDGTMTQAAITEAIEAIIEIGNDITV